ncbi:hypothetical protein WJX73_008684 [Symbiochloris irregularis]|uniref:Uncharacterized protein n=1 Tax=Symbiochloris irregularis TaxID=706552 RepID=A0AAW1PLZ1_9CHLO
MADLVRQEGNVKLSYQPYYLQYYPDSTVYINLFRDHTEEPPVYSIDTWRREVKDNSFKGNKFPLEDSRWDQLLDELRDETQRLVLARQCMLQQPQRRQMP